MANSIIPDQSYFSDFRQRCEDKNTLQNKGDLYVGTGVQITADSGTEKAPIGLARIYKTDVLSAPDEANQVIISKGKSGTTQQGIEYKDILEALNVVIGDTGDKAVNRSKISNEVKIDGYPAATKIKIKMVSELPSPVDPSTLYIIF